MERMKQMILATIDTEIGTMEISLEQVGNRRRLIARANGHEEAIADQPQDGYAAGNKGIVDAIDDLRTWYSDPCWGLDLKVDWRDYCEDER